MYKVMLLSLFIFCSLFVTSCAQILPRNYLPDLTFAHLRTIQLDVRSVEIQDHYQPPLQMPNVEHQMPMPLYNAVSVALKKSLVAVNAQTTIFAYFIVERASVIHKKLEGDETIFGFFGEKPSDQYDGDIALRVDVFDGGEKIGTGHVNVKRQKKMYEGISPNDKDRAFIQMTEDMIKDLDRALKELLNSKFREIVI